MSEDETTPLREEWSCSEEQRELVLDIDEVIAEISSSVAAVHQLSMIPSGSPPTHIRSWAVSR